MVWTALTLDTWLSRQQATLTGVSGAVQNIIDEVAGKGDDALFDLCERFDKVKQDHLRVSEDEIDAAYESVDPEIIEALTEAYSRISAFHELQCCHGDPRFLSGDRRILEKGNYRRRHRGSRRICLQKRNPLRRQCHPQADGPAGSGGSR